MGVSLELTAALTVDVGRIAQHHVKAQVQATRLGCLNRRVEGSKVGGLEDGLDQVDLSERKRVIGLVDREDLQTNARGVTRTDGVTSDHKLPAGDAVCTGRAGGNTQEALSQGDAVSHKHGAVTLDACIVHMGVRVRVNATTIDISGIAQDHVKAQLQTTGQSLLHGSIKSTGCAGQAHVGHQLLLRQGEYPAGRCAGRAGPQPQA